METIINDKNLLRILKVKLCTGDKNKIEDIEDIDIQNVNLMQKKLNIDLKEIQKLKKLKKLSLKFFDITDEVIDSINKLEFIESIELYMCVFKSSKKINRNIKEMLIYNCENVNVNILFNSGCLEELELVHSGLVNIEEISRYKNLKLIKLSNCNVISIPKISCFGKLEYIYLNEIELIYDIDISKMKNLKFISLNGSNVSNKDEYIKKLKEQNESIKIIFEENNLPME